MVAVHEDRESERFSLQLRRKDTVEQLIREIFSSPAFSSPMKTIDSAFSPPQSLQSNVANIAVGLGRLQDGILAFVQAEGIHKYAEVMDLQKVANILGAMKDKLELSISADVTTNRALENNNAIQLQILQSSKLSLQTENLRLQEALRAALQKCTAAEKALELSKEEMQKEFASLWLAVQELNALDAQKESALADLISDRDRVVRDRDAAIERLKSVNGYSPLLTYFPITTPNAN